MQTRECTGLASASEEVSRIVSTDGVVIRQFRNHDAEILFNDGVRADFNKKRLEWVITNNLGKRRQFKDGVYTDLEYMPTAVETDQYTGARMMIREDGVVTVKYPDGSLFCQHRDGTKMHTSFTEHEVNGQTELCHTIIIEKKGFASHTIRQQPQDHPEDLEECFRSPKNRA